MRGDTRSDRAYDAWDDRPASCRATLPPFSDCRRVRFRSAKPWHANGFRCGNGSTAFYVPRPSEWNVNAGRRTAPPYATSVAPSGLDARRQERRASVPRSSFDVWTNLETTGLCGKGTSMMIRRSPPRGPITATRIESRPVGPLRRRYRFDAFMWERCLVEDAKDTTRLAGRSNRPVVWTSVERSSLAVRVRRG